MNRANTRRALEVVAVFEAAKGLLVLIAGLGLAALIHKDVEQIAENLVRHSHLNPASRYPRIFLEAAAHVDDRRLLLLALFAAGYAAIRLAEAYGLWHDHAWAEWLGALSGGIYVPVEIYHLARHVTLTRVLILLGNLAVVLFLSRELWRRRGREIAPPEATR